MNSSNAFSLELQSAPVAIKKKKTKPLGLTQRGLKARKKALIKDRQKFAKKQIEPSTRNNALWHKLDDDIMVSLNNKKSSAWSELFDTFDNDFNGFNCSYSYEWNDEHTSKLWLGILDRSFEIIRDCSDYSGEFFVEEMNWVLSEQFDMVCKSLFFDSNELREGLYNILFLNICEMPDFISTKLRSIHTDYLNSESDVFLTVTENVGNRL
jgi:hypothetical protein